jgi:hypothetical protein
MDGGKRDGILLLVRIAMMEVSANGIHFVSFNFHPIFISTRV